MNKILLINRLNTQDHTNEKRHIFFLLGGENLSLIENRLMDLLKSSGLVELEDIVYKYNGIELNIPVQKIPLVVKLLAIEDIWIYNIFEVYDPDL